MAAAGAGQPAAAVAPAAQAGGYCRGHPSQDHPSPSHGRDHPSRQGTVMDSDISDGLRRPAVPGRSKCRRRESRFKLRAPAGRRPPRRAGQVTELRPRRASWAAGLGQQQPCRLLQVARAAASAAAAAAAPPHTMVYSIPWYIPLFLYTMVYNIFYFYITYYITYFFGMVYNIFYGIYHVK